MKLTNTIKLVKEACKENELHPSDDMILDCSTRIYISNKISENKKENIQAINLKGNRQDTPLSAEPPTPKQIDLLNKNFRPIPETKKEAQVMIKEMIENSRGEKYGDTTQR